MAKIVLKSLVADKNPRLANRIPGFVYGWMNRLLHIREINEIIERYGELQGITFVQAVLDYFQVTCSFKGIENLPREGRFIFASNHPLGGFDGLLLMHGVTANLGPSLFLVRDELTKIPPLKELFIPINKFGNQRNSIDQIKTAYDSDNQILIFPAGLASRRIKGVITDLEWHKHFIQKSIAHQRDVIPVFMSGRNSRFFYNFSAFRKMIGIKFGLEMMLLPDEMFRQKGKSFTITFGKPIPWQSFNHSKSPTVWAGEVKERVYAVPSENS